MGNPQDHAHEYVNQVAFFYTGGPDCYLVMACGVTIEANGEDQICNDYKVFKGTALVFG